MATSPTTATLPPRLAALIAGGRPPYYLHRTFPALWWGMLLVALLLVAAALVFVVAEVRAGQPDFAVWALGAFAAVFLLLLLRPATWRVPVTMVADARGMHFLHGPGPGECHTVEWRDVGSMRIQWRAIDHGITPVVVVAIRSDSAFWTPALESRYMRHLLQPAEADGYRRLPLPAVWTSLARTLEALQELKSRVEG